MKERFISYAQEYEDLILHHVLKDVSEGRYIDVGANDPWELSVTKAFYDVGWSGINIEPLPESYDTLVQFRERDENLCVGAGSEDGAMTLYKQGTMSTVCTKYASDYIEQQSIPGKTLSRIVKESRFCDITEIHFIKIDVEGFEKSVLCGIDFDIIRPWVFVMESTFPGTDTPCHDEWEHILLDAGYAFAFQYGINRYYVEETKIELKSRFLDPHALSEVYDIF